MQFFLTCVSRGTSCSVCCWRPVAVRHLFWDLLVPTASMWTRSKPHCFSWRVWMLPLRSVSLLRPPPVSPALIGSYLLVGGTDMTASTAHRFSTG